jgi:membrane-bound serine protease (ClpP class)
MLSGCLFGVAHARAATPGVTPAHVNLIVLDTTINPAVADFIHESLMTSSQDGAAALIIQLDTPGGLLNSAKAIVKDLLSAPLPVIVYVAPVELGPDRLACL